MPLLQASVCWNRKILQEEEEDWLDSVAKENIWGLGSK